MEKATHILGGDFISIVGSAEGGGTIVRDVDDDFDGFSRLSGTSPKGASA